MDDGVYDVSSFLDEHPGGKKILQRVLGKDASKQFWKYHNEKVMQKYAARLKIGSIGSTASPETASAKPSAQTTAYSPPRPKLAAQHEAEKPASSDGKGAREIFGEVCSSSDIIVDSSLYPLLNRHGTRGSLPLITMKPTHVSASSCGVIWKNTSFHTYSNGKRPNSSPKNCSVKSPNKVLSPRQCSPSRRKNIWMELLFLRE